MTYQHETWKLVKRDIGWSGGTIHMLSDTVNCSQALLLADKGDRVEVVISGNWQLGTLQSLDGFPTDENGEYWAKFTAYVPGFNNNGVLVGLKGDYNIRKAM